MPKFTPCLSFQGQCNEAIELYREAFGAKVREKVLFSEASAADFQCKSEARDFVYYSEITIGNRRISLADDSTGVVNEKPQGKSHQVSLLMEFESDDILHAAYKILSDGATILTPMCSTTYCTAYVVVEDKFGICWQLMSGYAG